MKNEKGISTWVVILIIAIVIVAAIVWSKYFATPMATVMMQGADQAKPAIERAQRASDVSDRANKVIEDTAKNVNADPAKQQE